MSKFTDFFKKAGAAIVDFFKKAGAGAVKISKMLGVAHIACIAVLLVSAVLGISLGVWAQTDTSDAEIEMREAQVLFGESARTEYLVGETVSGEGVSLKAGKVEITDVEINCDTSSAGIKRVEVGARDGNIYWRGYYAVTVFSVRHYDLKSVPDSFTVDDDGNVTASGIEIWVDLNAKPTEIPTVGDFETVVALPEALYTVTVERDETTDGAYDLAIAFGETKLNYFCIDIDGKMTTLDSRDRILELNNTSGGDEKLTLFVTKIEDNGNDGENGAEGFYVFTDANGNTATYKFAFYLSGYTSFFVSSKHNEGLSDRYADDGSEGFFAVVGGITFKAEKLPWHKAILNWDN